MGKGLIGCIRNHFGILPGKKLTDMAAEIKELEPQDRWDIVSGFKSGHGTEEISDDAFEKERAKAAEAGITKASAGYGGLATA